jgi:hypothetical protein
MAGGEKWVVICGISYTHIEVVHLPLWNCLRDFFPFFRLGNLGIFNTDIAKLST